MNETLILQVERNVNRGDNDLYIGPGLESMELLGVLDKIPEPSDLYRLSITLYQYFVDHPNAQVTLLNCTHQHGPIYQIMQAVEESLGRSIMIDS